MANSPQNIKVTELEKKIYEIFINNNEKGELIIKASCL